MSTKPGDWWERSWNPITGCNPISEGCDHCWAKAMEHRLGRDFSIKWHPERMGLPGTINKPTRFFVGSLTDIFHPGVNNGMLRDMFWEIQLRGRHTFVTLTKRPRRAVEFMVSAPGLPNHWFGITVENQARFDERWPHLKEIPAGVKFLHMEPLLGPVDISLALPHVQWVVVGGENGHGARPMHPAWVRNIRDQCAVAGVRFWFKGWGKWIPSAKLGTEAVGAFTSLDLPQKIHFPRDHRGLGPFDHIYATTGFCDMRGSFHQKTYRRLLDGREWSELPEVTNDPA